MDRSKSITGLTFAHIELTSKCNKSCWMCGRRKLEEISPEKCNWDDMNFRLVKKIAPQLPRGIIVHLHNNGEPLMYPLLREALLLFGRQIRCFNTNAKLLLDKAYEVIGMMERLTISIIPNDPEADEQYETVKRFLLLKGDKKPYMVYRLLGAVENSERWSELPGTVVKRILHNPLGSYDYVSEVTKPECGFCIEPFSHIAIDKDGLVSVCVRFDPEKKLVIGDIKKSPLWRIWHSEERAKILKAHINDKRHELPVCSECDYYGIPKGE